MAKVSYANLKLKVNTDVKTFKVGDAEVEVLQYLPYQDKYDLVMLTLQNAEEKGIYNPIKLDRYFNLYLVYMYTNINFTEKQREDEEKLYDTLESNGVIEQTINAIPDNEYETLLAYIEEIKEERKEHSRSVGGLISSFIQDLPQQAEVAKNIIDNFDKEKFQEVVNFAKAANGGRNIN